MKEQEFKIFKEQKERERIGALGEIDEKHASRGTAISGYRNQDIKALNEKFDSEIEMERIRMESEEKISQQWFPNGNWRPFILNTLVAIIVGVVVYSLTH